MKRSAFCCKTGFSQSFLRRKILFQIFVRILVTCPSAVKLHLMILFFFQQMFYFISLFYLLLRIFPLFACSLFLQRLDLCLFL